MQSVQNQEGILKEYERKGEEITRKMSNVLIRTRRKIDDVAYRKILEKINREN